MLPTALTSSYVANAFVLDMFSRGTLVAGCVWKVFFRTKLKFATITLRSLPWIQMIPSNHKQRWRHHALPLASFLPQIAPAPIEATRWTCSLASLFREDHPTAYRSLIPAVELSTHPPRGLPQKNLVRSFGLFSVMWWIFLMTMMPSSLMTSKRSTKPFLNRGLDCNISPATMADRFLPL